MSWSVEDSTAFAMVVEPGPLPEALARLSVLSTPRGRVRLADQLGRIDSLRLGQSGAAWLRLRPLGAIRASLGPAAASTTLRDSLALKPVMLIGSAGWEAKFVAAALEEDGWTVSTRLQVAPAAVVRQGTLVTIDTGSYSAIVVIDSVSALEGERIRGFVNAGGGLVAAGPGIRHPALRSLIPRQLREEPAVLGGLFGIVPRLGLNARVLALRPTNVVFERRNGDPMVVALRVGSGRIVAAGYDDTWRLRMVPPNENAPKLHRDWWSSVVGSVAMTRLAVRDAAPVDEAPRAATVAALGPPVTAAEVPGGGIPFPWDVLLATIAAGALLTEWLSRRLRGVA